MNIVRWLAVLASMAFLAGCATQPAELGGGKYVVRGYKLERVLERARAQCGAQEMVTIRVSQPIQYVDWASVTFFCR